MAKPRKPKNEDSKPENSGAVVRHQKLCLSVDMDHSRIYGYTELEIAVPDIGIVGLHAENLGIETILVDGEPTEFEYYPHHQHGESEKGWDLVSSPIAAADAASVAYTSALERELAPNLLINCCKAFKSVPELQDQMHMENGFQSSTEAKQNVKLVRINYWVERTETGIHFDDNVIHTNNQIRRARCWFPCMDDSSQRCCYDLEFTVSQNLVAVSTGSLLYQVLSKDDPPRKTYVYRVETPVAARWISLAVAPFEILPDSHIGLISHMCLPANLSKLHNSVQFFHNAFRHYEEYLAAKFPFGSYKQVFLAPEMAVSSSNLGASLCIFSSQVLYDDKVIDLAIDTSVKLAFALARQWFGVYITAETPNDEWLLDGLADFLTDSFIKTFLGNNEARYRRYKANCAVCRADDSGATALSSSASCRDLYGTHCIGIYGKIRSWKSVSVLQMLEKQMGPESFRKILQTVVSRAQDDSCPVRSLSTKEFRHFANKVGNLERPFLKEFFPRWVGSCGCPVLRMGFSYNKRKNMVELAVLRECTAAADSSASTLNATNDSEIGDGDNGWPGMMSIRVYELDGMYDHPVLPLTGDTWQLFEIQCHSKLAARRAQKPKKGSKPDGSDDNVDIVPTVDMRTSMDSPLSWIRADPEMEYLAEIHFNQPIQMWINQLEKDQDVVAQTQAIAALEAQPQISFSIVNALNNFLCDSKAFWRVRIEAVFALASTASEETDWAGLHHLVKFYKSKRFDTDIGLPKSNDFHDFPEYFVLEAIPHAVAMVRTAEKKSPREAVEFVLQLLKYNDNNGNPYSDVFWLAALVQSVGELEFGQQSIIFLSSLLKRIDRLLQFDRLMPSYNGILTISCIRTLIQIAFKLSEFIHLDHVFELIKPFQESQPVWQVRIEASKALLDIEFHCKGIDAALSLFMKYVEEEPSFRGQVKLGVHALQLCDARVQSDFKDDIKSTTLVALLRLLESRLAFSNVFLRHHLFCILQVIAGRTPTLFGVPREKTLHMDAAEFCGEPKNVFSSILGDAKPLLPSADIINPLHEGLGIPETSSLPLEGLSVPDTLNVVHEDLAVLEASKEVDTVSHNADAERKMDVAITDVPKEADSVSNSHERRMPVVKIRVKRSSAASSNAEEVNNQAVERSHGGHHEIEHGASSSVSVDAPQRNSSEAMNISNQNPEEVNSCPDHGSRMTASIGSAKVPSGGETSGKDLQCTADSSKVFAHRSSPGIMQDNSIDNGAQKYASLQRLSVPGHEFDGGSSGMISPPHSKEKEKKKGTEKKRKREGHKHRDGPEYLERKRLKKERKQKEKEMAKLLSDDMKASQSQLENKKEEASIQAGTVRLKPNEASGSAVATTKVEKRAEPSEGSSAPPKFRIKIKNLTLNKQ
ncbi:transcription initiation factor TFIID subunit 2 isoform X1 [Tripterygium wilfordii]|uniref:Transcription initiation factor TFIID subunit 2 n=1 Tax=Tripterygium wilfordii TaxID=458696 RepID=A0A7J7C7Y2_TRIWF|nr:transcription initiation factor TFIID subunit 2 isoform X2 [Tripterygium wilfordii]KAF5730251.1 transcription initiation factor TFIID subunit 2 isoform X1 [Tripterygium wilfordii]